MTLSDTLGAFVAGLDLSSLPPEVAEKARCCVLNGYGIALGSHPTPFAPVARRAAIAIDGERPDGATLLGDGRKTSVASAAMANRAFTAQREASEACAQSS